MSKSKSHQTVLTATSRHTQTHRKTGTIYGDKKNIKPGDPQRSYPLSSSRRLRKQYTPFHQHANQHPPPSKNPSPTAQNTPTSTPKHPQTPKNTHETPITPSQKPHTPTPSTAKPPPKIRYPDPPPLTMHPNTPDEPPQTTPAPHPGKKDRHHQTPHHQTPQHQTPHHEPPQYDTRGKTSINTKPRGSPRVRTLQGLSHHHPRRPSPKTPISRGAQPPVRSYRQVVRTAILHNPFSPSAGRTPKCRLNSPGQTSSGKQAPANKLPADPGNPWGGRLLRLTVSLEKTRPGIQGRSFGPGT